jgi:predicted nucleotidyltransferase component of viral defense system
VALLYARSQALVFKGGTALRMIYKGNRYSEDLDFNGPNDVPRLRTLWAEVGKELEFYGIGAEIRQEWQSEFVYSFDVSYRGPLYEGRDRSKGKVRVDVSLREESVATRRELVTAIYDDIRPFVAIVLTPEHLFAEKLRALLVRAKPRDLYDLWLMSRQGWRLDRNLLAQKLALYDLAYTTERLNETVARVAADWERDMRPLLPQYVPFEDVSRVVQMLKP